MLSSTRIPLVAPVAGEVTLDVFDIRGRQVRSLVTPVQAGTNSIEWDGRNHADESVADGVYFYRIQTATETLTRKLIVKR